MYSKGKLRHVLGQQFGQSSTDQGDRGAESGIRPRCFSAMERGGDSGNKSKSRAMPRKGMRNEKRSRKKRRNVGISGNTDGNGT